VDLYIYSPIRLHGIVLTFLSCLGTELRIELVFLKCSVRIWVEIPAILTEISWFPSALQANTGITPLLGHDRFLPNPFQFVFIYVILPADAR
jgi:hypothetical protein